MREKLTVIVASHNPVKIGAVRAAFAAQWPSKEFKLLPLNVASGVGEQPMSDEETLRGARNRVINAHQAHPQGDFWVGLEGGLDRFDGQLMAFAWMAIRNRAGDISEARSATLPLPPEIQRLVDEGLELGDANDRVFSTLNSKQGGGAFGLLTDGRHTRESIYSQTLEFALIPFAHPLWPG